MTDPTKLFSPSTTLQEMVDGVKHYNAGQMNMIFRNNNDVPIAAVIVVRGEWTKDVLSAIDQLEQAAEGDRDASES